MYQVVKNGKYFKSNGYVNSSGLCDSHTWVSDRMNAFASLSDRTICENIANLYGGKVVKF